MPKCDDASELKSYTVNILAFLVILRHYPRTPLSRKKKSTTQERNVGIDMRDEACFRRCRRASLSSKLRWQCSREDLHVLVGLVMAVGRVLEKVAIIVSDAIALISSVNALAGRDSLEEFCICNHAHR